jgi:hypothetical protein
MMEVSGYFGTILIEGNPHGCDEEWGQRNKSDGLLK